MISKILCLTLFVGISLAGTPWVGEPRTDSWWQSRHQGLLNQTAAHKADLKVIFFGDSITDGWAANGKQVWNKYYAPRHAYNYGIGGDSTQHLVWRMEHGEFDGLNSKVVVLKIGTNNLCCNNEADIAHGIKEVVDQILKRQPHAKVLLLAIIPRAGADTEHKIMTINKIISGYQENKRVFYLDMSPHFETTPGNVIADLYVGDKLHLSAKGYEMWHQVMEPLFSKLYNSQ